MIDVLTHIINTYQLKDIPNLFLINKFLTQVFLNKLNYNYPRDQVKNHIINLDVSNPKTLELDPKSAYLDCMIKLDHLANTIQDQLANYQFNDLVKYDIITANGYSYIFDGFNYINYRYGVPNHIRLFEQVSTEYWINFDIFINFNHKPYLDQLRNNLNSNTYFVHNDEIYWITFYDVGIFLAALNDQYLLVSIKSKYELIF